MSTIAGCSLTIFYIDYLILTQYETYSCGNCAEWSSTHYH